MKILGIETSCDDTSASVAANGTVIVSNVISSQIRIHRRYNGIVPELASRHHLENINFVLAEALSGCGKIDAVAVTAGPGLIGSLLVGTTTAQVAASVLGVPLVGINHIEGHIFANCLGTKNSAGRPLEFPSIGLVISGGHTDLVFMEKLGRYHVLGRTRDDAVGEVFDKVAKHMGLGYPGGPAIDMLAKRGDAGKIKFPRPHMPGTWDFSFSGLKTAAVNYADTHGIRRGRGAAVRDFCASFQQACVDVLVKKTMLAAKSFGIKNVLLGGGVSSNSQVRRVFFERCREEGIVLRIPPVVLCTDNAAMAASAGYFKLRHCGAASGGIDPDPNLELTCWPAKN